MTYLYLLLEFLKIGTFSIGGGLATLPFLYALASRYDWFDQATLIDMIAISESTPGAIGINMATYAGFTAGGIGGGILASIAMITPGILMMMVISKVLTEFKENPLIIKVFYGIRPAVAALIAYAAYEMLKVTMFENHTFSIETIHIGSVLLFFAFLLALFKTKIHPVIFIVIAAVLGIFLPL